MMTATEQKAFDIGAAGARCRKFRRRILEVSKLVQALHIGGAFSCIEILDVIYFGLMRREAAGTSPDTFLLSKGHGCMAQYAILEELGVLPRAELDRFCAGGGILGVHPDYQNPGIEASTGALGHGLAMAVGMAYAELSRGRDGIVYCVLSDGEAQEGSTWEATLMASSLGLSNLIVFMDNNDFQSLERTSKSHPTFYPVVEKYRSFGWECHEVPGHDSAAIHETVIARDRKRPLMVNCRTTKGKGVSYMEGIAMWHYRSPSPAEYDQAMKELAEPA
jgi:transketolase